MRLARRTLSVVAPFAAIVLLGAVSDAGRPIAGSPIATPPSAAQQRPAPAEILDDDEIDGFPVDVEFVDTRIRDVLRFFSEAVGLSLVIDPEVDGIVNVSMSDAPWDVALIAVLGSHGLDYTVRGGIARITTVEKLIDEATARARLLDERVRADPLRTVTFELAYAQATDLVRIVERQLSPRGSVVADTRTNSLIVTDTEAMIRAIRRLVEGGR